ncbi:MAG: sigma-54 dependent transcriptional regulator [bacterium]
MNKKILVVDDEKVMLESLNKILSTRKEYIVELAQSSSQAFELIQEKKFHLVLTDLKIDEKTGIDVIEQVLKTSSNTLVIVISGYGTIESSVEAIRKGAFDFIEKPFTSKKLFDVIDRALEAQESLSPKEELTEENTELPGLIYKSREMEDVACLVRKIAKGNMNVLITGESGTGKELIARSIHTLSKGNTCPFVPVNCGALPEPLFESELFGHEKGAFTGAVRTKPGLLEFADTGTFFFDEIGDMSISLQIKLLRMLEEKKIRRVGGQKEIPIDVRIIAATNKNLEQAVTEGRFRDDLYYRLNTIHIKMPPLRDRKDDILLLANHFLKELCEKEDKTLKTFSADAVRVLMEYSWPGNIRELQNIIGRIYVLSTNQIINETDLPLPIQNVRVQMEKEFFNYSFKDAKEKVLENFEVDYINYHLRKNKGNISKTAEVCGIDRRSIHRLLNKYKIIYKERE